MAKADVRTSSGVLLPVLRDRDASLGFQQQLNIKLKAVERRKGTTENKTLADEWKRKKKGPLTKAQRQAIDNPKNQARNDRRANVT